MNRTATLLAALCLTAGVATAQPSRTASGPLQDAIWARDIGAATITVDGVANEPQWAQAESIRLTQDGSQVFFTPGGGNGGRDAFNGVAAPNPGLATVRYLRKGNTLYLAVEVVDASVGGRRGFFEGDGLIFSVVDKRNRANIYPGGVPTENSFNGEYTDETFYSWMNVGPNALPARADSVGTPPIFLGNFINGTGGVVDNVLQGATTVNGVSNDDRNRAAVFTADGGYTMELRLELGTLGFDMNRAAGDRAALTLAVYDRDNAWPVGQQNLYQGRSWFQSKFGGDMPDGTAYIYGSPAVTVSSGAVPSVTEPDLRVPALIAGGNIAVDGRLLETAWTTTAPQVTLQYRMTEAMLDALPGLGPYYSHWFRPGGGSTAPPVVDPSTARIRFVHQGSTLFVGLDSDDQAISGQTRNDSRFDGLRVTVRDLTPIMGDNYIAGNTLPARRFTVVMDSLGRAKLLDDAANPLYAPSIRAGARPKGTGTAGNSSDIDAGYQIEMAINLTELGFDPANRLVWIGAAYYDGDDLDVAASSYGMRTWWLTEQTAGPTARLYLDPTRIVGTAGETGPLGDGQLRTLGAAPNPVGGRTALRYELASASDVTVEVFDVLGRLVGRVEAGPQAAGVQQVAFDVSALSPGAYVYRVRTAGGAAAAGQLLVTR